MKNDKFKELLLQEDATKILKNYMFNGLNLSEKQLGIVIDLKNKKNELKDVLKRFKRKRKKYGRCVTKN